MDKQQMEIFDRGYNEGFLFASQAMASRVIRLIMQHPTWMLEPDRRQAIADIKLSAKHMMVRKGVIPSSYKVIMGLAEEVPLDFDMDY